MIRINGNKYLLRAPQLPVQRAEQCLAGDHEQWLKHDAFHYGLYLSSAELYQEFRKQEAAGELTPKMMQTLRKYWIRSSTRCTPYANFAGCAVGSIGERTAIIMGDAQQLAESCRLDMDLLHRFVQTTVSQPGIRGQLKWIRNNSIYRQGKKIRYVRHEPVNNKRKYFLSEVAYNNVLWQLLQRASHYIAYADLELVLLDAGLDQEDAAEYLQSLIENQLLLHELEPAISGVPPMLDLIQRFSSFESLQPQAALLQELEAMLAKDHFNIDRLKQVTEKMDAAGLDRSGVQTLFQSDLYLHAAQNTISGNILKEVVAETGKLISAIYPFKETSDDLKLFRERFLQRYEEQELPLCEVLDVEHGIGYGNYNNNTASLVNDLEWPGRPRNTVNRFAQLMQQKAQLSTVSHAPVVLTDADLDELILAAGGDPGYSGIQSAGILGSLYGKNTEEIDAGDYSFFLRFISGPSSANLLGRFCHLHEDVHRMTADITASEAALLPADTVFAEIIHLPQDRIGNILLRPVLRGYEIPFLGNSGAGTDKQIRVDDLMVSVRNGQVLLRSRSLGKYVIPRLSTAHNFMFNSLPMYQFLCELQWQQSFRGLFLEENGDADFYPEVRYKHIIVQRARWRLLKQDVKDMPVAEAAMPAYISEWRKKRKLPLQLLLLEQDNELLIDLRYPESFRMLVAAINKNGECRVTAFPGKEAMGAVSGVDGNYCNEVFIPVLFGEPAALPPVRPAKTIRNKVQRKFLPGDEWLYFKIYCGTAAAEELLAGPLRRLSTGIISKGLASHFFFIRYYDPDPHIRIRYQASSPENIGELMLLMKDAMKEYVAQKLVTKIQLDTYTRELERYGRQLIGEAEQVFHADSEAVMEMLHWLQKNDAQADKWQFAVAGIDQYLVDFGYNLKQKLAHITQLQQGFLQESGGGKPLLLQLNNKHRALKQELAAVFSNSPSLLVANGRSILQRRSRKLEPVIRKIRGHLRRQEKTADDLLASYLHMFIDRLFDTDNRKYELLLYHLLLKHYTSEAAMQQKKHT